MEVKKPFVGIRVEPEILIDIDKQAKAENRTRTGLILHAIKTYLGKEKAKK